MKSNRVLIIVIFLFLCVGYSSAFFFTASRQAQKSWRTTVAIRQSSRVYSSETDLKKWVSQSEMIIVIPTDSTRAIDISELRKALPFDCKTDVISAHKIIDAVDSGPFCQLQEVTSTNFVIFIEKDHNAVYEIFCKWIRQIAKETTTDSSLSTPERQGIIEEGSSVCLVCRKGILLRVSKDGN